MSINGELKELSKGINIIQSIFIVLSILIYQLIISFIIATLDKSYKITSNNTAIYDEVLKLLVAYILIVIKYTKIKRYHLKFVYKLDLKIYLFSILVMVGYTLTYHNTLGILILNIDKNSQVIKSLNILMSTPIAAIITIVLIAPVFEEIIFRGIILEQLSIRYSPAISIIISSILFSIFHLNLIQGVNVFFIGILSGIIYLKTNSVVPCILLHFTDNLFAYMTQYFSVVFTNNFSILQLIVGVIILIISMFIYRDTPHSHQTKIIL